MHNNETRMATEKLGKLMLTMGIPTLVAQLINLLYNIVDRMFIGHIPGSGAMALTGVGLCFPIITLISAFAQLAGAGGAPQAAICLGKDQREDAHRILGNAVTLLIGFAVGLIVVILIVKEPFLYLFGASDNTYPYASEYLSIYLIGTLFVMLTLGLNNFITAQGQPKIAMISVLIGAIANTALDPLFIFAFGLGIKGAAWATVLSQLLSAIWTVRFLTSKKATLRIRLSYMKPSGTVIKKIISLGIAPFIMFSTDSLIVLVLNRGMLLYGNDLYVASITILQSEMQILYTAGNGFTSGVQPIISYNYGAGNIKRMKDTCRRMLAYTIIALFAAGMFMILFPAKMAGLFTTDPELIEICRQVTKIYLAGMTIFGIQVGCQPIFLALNQAKKSLFFALLRKIILLLPLALILPGVTHSVMGIYVAEPISDVTSALVCGITFLVFMKRKFKTE